jgi:hypothetical protein
MEEEEEAYTGPVYKLGKITSKYLIIEILAYSNDELTLICEILHYCSRDMRNLFKKNYIVMRNMLYQTHTLEGILPLIRNYKTSQTAHLRLEKIVMRECERVTTNINYGLQILPDTVLHIANTQENHWLLQPELKAINDGLTFIEKKHFSARYEDDYGQEYGYKANYRGYLNEQGQR